MKVPFSSILTKKFFIKILSQEILELIFYQFEDIKEEEKRKKSLHIYEYLTDENKQKIIKS